MNKKHSIVVILFALLFLNLFSCEKENLNSSEIVQEKLENEISQKTFQEILNDNQFKSAYKKTLKFKERNLEGARTSSDTNSDFTIDSTSVNVVTTDEFTSYNIRITRDNPHPSYTENLLIQIDSTGTSKSYIVKYTPSVKLVEVENHSTFKFQGSVEAIDIEYDLPSLRVDEECTIIYIRFCDWSTGSVHADEAHLAGPKCTPGFMFWEPFTVCDGNDAGGFDDDYFSYDYGNSAPDGGGSNGTGTGAAPVVHPCDDPIHNCNAIAGRLASKLNLNYEQREWLFNQSELMITTLDNLSYSSQGFAKSSIDILSSPIIITSNNQIDYANAILKMTNHLKQFGEIEDEIYADYIESLIPEFINMSMGEVRGIYLQVNETVNQLTKNYLFAIITPIVTDLVIPIITYAIFEATAGTAIKLLQKIPVSMMLRGIKLNKMVTKIAQIGVQGEQAHVKVITTASPVTKAEELFLAITKDRIGLYTYPAPNVKVANMGNGNYITFRTVSSSEFPATINLNFPAIFGQTPKALKFTQ